MEWCGVEWSVVAGVFGAVRCHAQARARQSSPPPIADFSDVFVVCFVAIDSILHRDIPRGFAAQRLIHAALVLRSQLPKHCQGAHSLMRLSLSLVLSLSFSLS